MKGSSRYQKAKHDIISSCAARVLHLQEERGISFEDVVLHISLRNIPDTFDHPNQERYPNQKLHVIDMEGHAYLMPFVESEDEVFLKTIIPSRKATQTYLGGQT